MDTHIYVDESKAKDYLVVAAIVTGDAQTARRAVQSLVLPGQRTPHMKAERDSRRHQIADTIGRMSDLGLRAIIYNAGRRYCNEKERRAGCLRALVHDAALLAPVTITFDRDESLEAWDRQRMIELTRHTGLTGQLCYTHAHRNNELLLCLPDAVAWCWAHGGDWRRRITPIIQDVQNL